MADKNLLQQMLESLVNDDQAKAEELFHEYVVTQSREIYESMIDSEIAEETEEDDEEEVDESSHKDEEDDEDLDENFEDIAIEGDDDMDLDSEDPTDDLAGEIGPEEEGDDEFADKSEAELFQDLDSIVDELQAKFDAMNGDHKEPDADNMDGPSDMDADNMDMKDDFDLETVREYVEKVATPKGGDNGANAKSIVAAKNDMGGTTANIAKGGESKGEGTKGGLLNPAAKQDNAGNINVPGGKAGNAFSKKETAKPGDNGVNTASLFRGRR